MEEYVGRVIKVHLTFSDLLSCIIFVIINVPVTVNIVSIYLLQKPAKMALRTRTKLIPTVAAFVLPVVCIYKTDISMNSSIYN